MILKKDQRKNEKNIDDDHKVFNKQTENVTITLVYTT